MNPALRAAKPTAGPVTDPVRVMLVDDSIVVRGLISRWIDEDRDLAVVASHRNGKLALDDIERSDPDVVVLDIEMPEMDGLTALPLMLKKKPSLVIIMASTLTRRNAEIGVRAMSLGAQDYVPKPETNSGVTTSVEFRRELTDKVRHLGKSARKHAVSRQPAPVRRSLREPERTAPVGRPAPSKPRKPTSASATAPAGKNISLRAYSRQPVRILAIGTSTGGPQALAALMSKIGPSISRVPVLVTQHMPPTFTAILAEHLCKASGRPAHEGIDGEELKPGIIYVAPGGKHMLIKKRGAGAVIKLDDGPQVNFCKPAVDPLFESVAETYGGSTLALVLTGMGNDGTGGSLAITKAGGSVIAQDEKSSVVWGMPGAAAHAGVCSDVLSLDNIGLKVSRILEGGRS